MGENSIKVVIAAEMDRLLTGLDNQCCVVVDRVVLVLAAVVIQFSSQQFMDSADEMGLDVELELCRMRNAPSWRDPFTNPEGSFPWILLTSGFHFKVVMVGPSDALRNDGQVDVNESDGLQQFAEHEIRLG